MVAGFQKDLFYDLFWTSWSASWFACNHRPKFFEDEFQIKVNKKFFDDNSKGMLQKGMEIGLSEHVLNNIKEGAENAAWWTANTKFLHFIAARKNKRFLDDCFDKVISSNELDLALAVNIKWMFENIGWYCANERSTGRINIKNLLKIVEHSKAICSDLSDLVDLPHVLMSSSLSDETKNVINKIIINGSVETFLNGTVEGDVIGNQNNFNKK